MTEAQSHHEDVEDAASQEYEEDYNYQDWGVDRVDLDFKSVADLQSLLSERRRGQLSYTIYKLYDKIDARLRQDLKSVTIIPEAGSSTRTNQQSYNELNHIKTSSSIQPSQNTATTPGSSLTSIHNILSSTDSIHKQEHHHESIIDNILSSNLSSTEPSLLPSMPTDDPESSSFGSFLINFAFIVLFIVVSVFVLIQCSHFAVYIARQAFKNRDSGRKLPDFIRSRLTTDTEVTQDYSLNERNVRGLVVEVDMTNQHHVTQHHTAISPASPVSILQNSPFYSPVKHSAQPTSPHSSTFSTPFMEQVIGNVCSDDQEDLDSIHQDDPQQITNDSDEGIESEDGEDIDGEAFKQLIRENVPENKVYTKSPLVYSNCFIRGEEIYGKNFTAGVNVTDNGYYDPGVGAGGRGYSVESPSCSISLSSDQNSSSLTPPSPLLTVPRWEVVGPIPASGVGECLI